MSPVRGATSASTAPGTGCRLEAPGRGESAAHRLLGSVSHYHDLSPSTPAAARAASSSSCGAAPASSMTRPSIAPRNASATALAGGPGGIDPALRPALIRRTQRLTSVSETRSSSAPDRMILTAELEPQRDRHAGHVSPAVDRVTARQGDQRRDRIRLLLDRPADLLPPGLIYPLDHRQGEVLLVLELVIDHAARVARVRGDPLEDQVPVAIARQASRGGLQQSAARERTALCLGATCS